MINIEQKKLKILEEYTSELEVCAQLLVNALGSLESYFPRCDGPQKRRIKTSLSVIASNIRSIDLGELDSV